MVEQAVAVSGRTLRIGLCGHSSVFHWTPPQNRRTCLHQRPLAEPAPDTRAVVHCGSQGE